MTHHQTPPSDKLLPCPFCGNAAPTDTMGELLMALRQIDALDPEGGIHAFSKEAMAGLVMRMGLIARHAIAKAEATSAPTPAPVSGERLKPIERDEARDRTYIPLPGGWEIQTKGKGSTFRIAHVRGPGDYDRWPVIDNHLHEPLEQLARAAHTALRTPHGLPGGVDELSDEALWPACYVCFHGFNRDEAAQDIAVARKWFGEDAVAHQLTKMRKALSRLTASRTE